MQCNKHVKALYITKRKENFRMKLRQCMIMGIIVSVIMGSMSGCGVKEDGYQQSGQKEQIIESSQIQKEYDETENMGKENAADNSHCR